MRRENASVCGIGAGPVDAKAAPLYRGPDQVFGWRVARVVVESGSALVEAAGVPGIAELKAVKVEVMAELVAQSAEEGAIAGDVFADGGAHPDADEIVAGLVVAEELGGGIFANTEGASGENLDAATRDAIEVGGGREKGVAGAANIGGGAFSHGGVYCGGDLRKLSVPG